jgi:hypothetical protein
MKRESKRSFRNERSVRWVLYVVILLVAALFLPSSAMAHKPFFVEEGSFRGFQHAYEIPDPTTSYAFYSRLTEAGKADFYVFTAEKETPFYARISVPKSEKNRDFSPAFALFGPGLPTTNTPPSFPIGVPEEQGRAFFLPTGEQDEFFEPFTQTTLLQRQYVSRTLQPGTYYLAVWDPMGHTGKYVLTTGEEERFSLGDWLSLPLTWYKVRMWYDATQTWLILGSVLVGAGWLVYLLANRRREEE